MPEGLINPPVAGLGAGLIGAGTTAPAGAMFPTARAAGTAAAVARTPEMGAGTELIFVEGHSRDDTWAKIQEVAAAHPDRGIKILRQSGNEQEWHLHATFPSSSALH